MSALVNMREHYRRWLFDHALPLWWERGADHANGGFHEALTLDGAPVMANRRARVQARQIYVYATAGEMGWAGPWREAVQHGLDFFLEHYLRPDGQVRTLVSPEGAALDDTAHLYDQAFAILALASAYPVARNPEALRVTALKMRDAILVTRRLKEGGFAEVAPHVLQSNAHMHLFEAALAWVWLGHTDDWGPLADEIAELCFKAFLDDRGQIHEFFAPGWKFASGIDGQIVEPGHQFEWCWLIHRYGSFRRSGTAHAIAHRLREAGLAGVDHRGVATQQMLADGVVHDATARLWPQTEWIKACEIRAAVASKDEYPKGAKDVEKAAEALWLYLDTPLKGVWRDKLRPDGTWVEEPAPASSFYHIVCALSVMGVG